VLAPEELEEWLIRGRWLGLGRPHALDGDVIRRSVPKCFEHSAAASRAVVGCGLYAARRFQRGLGRDEQNGFGEAQPRRYPMASVKLPTPSELVAVGKQLGMNLSEHT
jgi:hypothetical protein